MFVHCIVYCVQCTPFPSVAEICARLAGNFCQYITSVSCWANSLVWMSVCYFPASWQGGGGRGEWGNFVSIALHSLSLPGPGGESREGGCVPSPWFWASFFFSSKPNLARIPARKRRVNQRRTRTFPNPTLVVIHREIITKRDMA